MFLWSGFYSHDKSRIGSGRERNYPVLIYWTLLTGAEDKPLVPPPDEAPATVTLPNHQPPAPPVSQQGVQSQPPMSMDAPFMQQQNQIFVFSTGLANQAAECVMQGQYKSILAFHMDQPGTKKILQVCCGFISSLVTGNRSVLLIFFFLISNSNQ